MKIVERWWWKGEGSGGGAKMARGMARAGEDGARDDGRKEVARGGVREGEWGWRGSEDGARDG